MTYDGYGTPSTTITAFGTTSQLLVPNGYRPDIDYDVLVPLHNYGSNGAGLLTRIEADSP